MNSDLRQYPAELFEQKGEVISTIRKRNGGYRRLPGSFGSNGFDLALHAVPASRNEEYTHA
jgi:hypothetical protein